MKNLYDSEELKMLCEANEIKETLSEMKRVLILCRKSNNIKSQHLKETVESFNELSQAVVMLDRSSAYRFYKKYNFFRAGVRVEFKN